MAERVFRGLDDEGSTRLFIRDDRLELSRPGTSEPVVVIPFSQIVWVEIGGATQGALADLVLILRGRNLTVHGMAREEIWEAYEAILGAARIAGRWGY